MTYNGTKPIIYRIDRMKDVKELLTPREWEKEFKENVDVDALLKQKHEYNKTRPYLHGGKKL